MSTSSEPVQQREQGPKESSGPSSSGATSAGVSHSRSSSALKGLSYVQAKASLAPAAAPGYSEQSQSLAPIQFLGGGASGVHAAAAHGISGGGGSLPFLGQIQQSFGSHDVSNVVSHTGVQAKEANSAMGSTAYATGNHVSFGGSPDLHTAAHEAAHVVQQRGGVQLKGGVGQAGDQYEQHADAVADLVVQGKSAESLLDRYAGGGGSSATQAKPAPGMQFRNQATLGSVLSGVPAIQMMPSLPELSGGYQAPMDFDPGGAIQFKGWRDYLMDGLAATGFGKQILEQIPLDTAIETAIEGFVQASIWLLGLNAAAKNLIGAVLTGGGSAFITVLDWIGYIISIYTSWPKPVRVALVYLMGVAINNIRQCVVGLVEQAVGKGAASKVDAATDKFLVAMASDSFASAFNWIYGIFKALLGDYPVSAAWTATRSYVNSWVRSYLGFSADTLELPEDQVEESGGSDESGPPPMSPISLGFMTIAPKKLDIVEGDQETGDKGGMGVAVDFNIDFLEKKRQMKGDSTVGMEAVVDWDRNFRWKINKKFTIFESLDFGMINATGIALEELESNNDRLRVSMSMAKLKIGSVAEVSDATATYDSQSGFYLRMDTKAKLPDPLAQASTAMILKTGAKGEFQHFGLEEMNVSDKFTIASASYDKSDGFRLHNAVYQLGDAIGASSELGLNWLEIDRTGKIKKVKGHFSVVDLEPIEGLTVGGSAEVGYDSADGFDLGISGAYAHLNKGGVIGRVRVKDANYKVKKKRFTSEIEELHLGWKKLSATVTDGEISNESGGYIKAAKAEIAFGKDATEQDLKEPAFLSGSGLPGGLASIIGQMGALSVTANDLLWTPKDGLSWGTYEVGTALRLPKAARFSLFGGLVSGHVDTEKGEGTLGSYLRFPPAGSKFFPSLTAEVPIGGLPLSVFVESNIDGFVGAGLSGTVKRNESNPNEYDVSGTAKMDAKLHLDVGGGLVLGSKMILGLRAYLQAYTDFVAGCTTTIRGKVKKGNADETGELEQTTGNDNKFEMDFDMNASLTAGVKFKADVVALMVLTKTLYEHKIKEWELGNFNLKGKLSQGPDGKIKPGVGEDLSASPDKSLNFHGALDKDMSVNESDWLEPIPVSQAVAYLKSGKVKSNDATFIRRLIYDVQMDQSLSTEQKAQLMEDIKGSTKVANRKISSYEARAQEFEASRVSGGFRSNLMPYQQWLEYSHVDYRRRASTKTDIDPVLKAYHEIEIPEGEPSAIVAALKLRRTKLLELKEALNDYLGKTGKSRTDMVKKLRFDVGKEEEALDTSIEGLESVEGISGPPSSE